METHGAQPEFNAHLSVPHPDWEQIAKDRGDLEKRLDELYQKPIHEFRKVPYVPPPLPSNVPESGRDISISDGSVTVRDGASIRIRVYKPLNISKGHTLFLNIHGGGWTTGRPETEEWQNRLIAYRTKVIVVSVDYRLAPEFPFPYALNDCWDVFDWTRKNAESLRVDPTSIIIGGGSAGANVSTVLVQLARDRGVQGVTGQVLNIPVTCHPDHFPSSKYSYTSFERNSHAPIVSSKTYRPHSYKSQEWILFEMKASRMQKPFALAVSMLRSNYIRVYLTRFTAFLS
ncbi:hypothetical protein NW754_014933 [Fusarium falciforme]|nr:hypothetical protein NW754_014933 [Fusarium falciforme]